MNTLIYIKLIRITGMYAAVQFRAKQRVGRVLLAICFHELSVARRSRLASGVIMRQCTGVFGHCLYCSDVTARTWLGIDILVLLKSRTLKNRNTNVCMYQDPYIDGHNFIHVCYFLVLFFE